MDARNLALIGALGLAGYLAFRVVTMTRAQPVPATNVVGGPYDPRWTNEPLLSEWLGYLGIGRAEPVPRVVDEWGGLDSVRVTRADESGSAPGWRTPGLNPSVGAFTGLDFLNWQGAA